MIDKPFMDELKQKEQREMEMLKLGFKGHVQPKLEERLNDVAKDLRMTL